MRKFYIPLAVLVAVLMGLTACHSGSHEDDSTVAMSYGSAPQKTVDYVNGNIKSYDDVFLPFSEKVIKSGLKAQKLFHDFGMQLAKKYPTPQEGLDPFTDSVGKEQKLLFMDLQNIFIDGNIYPRYTQLGWPSDIISDFQEKWEPFFKLHKNEGFFIYDPHKGQTVTVILERLQPLITDTDHLRDALVRLLNFDYTRFEAQWRPILSQFWKTVYETNLHSASFRTILLNIHKNMNMLKCEKIWTC